MIAFKDQLSDRPIVAVNGCFDMLHIGHLLMLEYAATFGSVFVGINSDASVRLLKGDLRPIIPEEQRAALVDGLECVRSVHIFDGPTAVDFLRLVKPDVWVKGSEYQKHPELLNAEELAIVREWGGRIEYAPSTPGISTSHILNRIYEGFIRQKQS